MVRRNGPKIIVIANNQDFLQKNYSPQVAFYQAAESIYLKIPEILFVTEEMLDQNLS